MKLSVFIDYLEPVRALTLIINVLDTEGFLQDLNK